MPINFNRNFRILWLGSLITDLGNAMTLPFIVLYIKTLGNFSPRQLNFLGAAAFAVTYASKALVSPWWGRLADQKGRKLMCLRASGAMTLTIIGVGLAPNVTILLGFRALQGAFSGYINNANALISLTTPVAHRGHQLSKLITGSITGSLLGPLIGGGLASRVGYRGAFFITGSLMALVFALTWWGVQEAVTPIDRQALPPLKPVLHQVGRPFFTALFASLLIIQATTNAITPLLSLLVGQLTSNTNQIILITGLVAAAPGLATVLMASRIGRLIDYLGASRCLIIFLGLAIIDLSLSSLVTQIWQLISLRFILGIADAALLPAIQVLTVDRMPRTVFGRIFSSNQSAQALGNVVGPGLAAVVATYWDYQPIFLLTAILELVALVLWLRYFYWHAPTLKS
ncbi:MFS transporter [Lactobacillus sp. CBA3605]|uniref:MFS transporter n=1 Tax=Lactobacillus sp. CBA3605 TaxID=2099788 RepID=UPI000CFB050D|nr:MFS transporter [Lactobacillus sp. CBA3605]AVK61225.1 MFS transporter [Lactobacillus sp. CBA3605]